MMSGRWWSVRCGDGDKTSAEGDTCSMGGGVWPGQVERCGKGCGWNMVVVMLLAMAED